MLNYRVSYRLQMGAFFAEVPDFPEASAMGASLAEARHNLIASITSAAQRKLRRGEMLPIPSGLSTRGEVYLEESVMLLPVADDRVEAQVGPPLR